MRIIRFILRDRLALLSCIFLGALSLIAVIFPLVSSADPTVFNPLNVGDPLPPSLRHPMGTDDLGRDMAVRMIYGARVSLLVGIISMSISVGIGLLVGLLSGFLDGWVSRFLMASVDFFLAIPWLFLILIIQIIFTPSIYNVMIVIGLTSWMGLARLVRAEVLKVKTQVFVTGLRSRGIPEFKILFKHILPHTLNPVIVALMLGMGSAILVESALSFLGLGVQPPNASWGNMLENALTYMRDAPWMALIPGTFITLTVVSLNFIGDALRAGLNTKERDQFHVSR
jgi:peptide/nickel transport system permease protein